MTVAATNPNRFSMDRERGFLPRADPLRHLPAPFATWEEVAQDLPKLLAARRLREALKRLPVVDATALTTTAEVERAMLLLSYFGHGYVWGGTPPATRIPAGVAVPWHQVAHRLGRPPILTYASYALHNWRRLDPLGPIALENTALLQNFLGGLDEEWFILVHVDIEARAAKALRAIGPAQEAALADRPGDVAGQLQSMAEAIEDMNRTLGRMPEACDPYIYFHRVRPYLFGWRDQPALPEGVVYDEVAEYGGVPQRFRGETGAETGILPCLDAALGISHREDELRHFLTDLRGYMPPPHRTFLEAVEAGPSIRDYLLAGARGDARVRNAYNACIAGIHLFRSRHLEYAGRYIQLQAQRGLANPTAVGTGGTPFLPYLRKHRDETEQHEIS